MITANVDQAKPPTAPAQPGSQRTARQTVGRLLMENGVLVMLVALIVYFSLNAPNFVSTLSFQNILVQASVPLVLAIPIGLMLMSNEVDLSIGSNVALSAVVAGLLMTNGQPVAVAMLGAVATGIAVGLLNAFLIAGLGVQSLIVTLGGLAAYRGIARLVSPDPLYGFNEGFVDFANGTVFGIPNLMMIALVVVAVGWLVLDLTPAGIHIRAVGISREASRLSGLRVKTIIVGLYASVGLAAGIVALMLAARVNSVPSATTGSNLEIGVLTAALLGGVALGGGRGRVRGLVIGVLFLTVLQTGLTMLNVPPAWSTTATGIALVVAAVIDRFSRPRDH